MKKAFLLSAFLLIALCGFVIADGAPSGGGGGGGGGGGSNNVLGLTIAQPSNGTIMVNSNVDILVQATTTVGASCQFSGDVCDNSNNCKQISYKNCPFCDLSSSYFTLANAYYDAVPGWNYNIQTTCTDASSNTQTGAVSFSVEGDASADKTPPQITVNSPSNGVNYVSNAQFNFDVNELSHCEYTIATGNGAGHISLPGYISNFNSQLTLNTGNNYTLTLDCTDLNGNSAEKIITYNSVSGGSSGGGGGSGSGSGGSSGGGQGSNGSSGNSSTCARYYACPDGTQINYCSIVSGVNGGGCGCSSNPASLCTSSTNSPTYSCSINDNKVNITENNNGILSTSASNFCFNFPSNVSDGTTVLQLTRLAIANNISLATIYQNRSSGQYLMQVTCDYTSSNNSRLYKLATSLNCQSGCSNGECIGNSNPSGGGGSSNSCPNGCSLTNICLPFGYRTSNEYCDVNNNLTQFKTTNAQCNNNFECSSNFCVSNQCVNPNLIQKIIAWFTRLFGGK